MKPNLPKIIFLLTLLFLQLPLFSQIVSNNDEFKTYCNPIDIDYSYMSHYRANNVSYRSGADPAVVNFKGKYYMFVTRSHGYWTSDDLGSWNFIRPQSWYFNGSNAPATAVYNDKIVVLGDPSGRGAVIETDNPDLGDWKTNFAIISVPNGVQDPDLFVDEDNRVYLYEESSNKWPIRGVELDAENYFIPKGKGKRPSTPKNFKVKRLMDRRNANLTWKAVKDATGYVIYWGIHPDKLNLSALIYDHPNYELRALNVDQKYYYQVEAFNENGISVRSEVLETD